MREICIESESCAVSKVDESFRALPTIFMNFKIES
jgi:hypothetical protein